MANFWSFVLHLFLPGGNDRFITFDASDSVLDNGIWGTNGTSIIAPDGGGGKQI